MSISALTQPSVPFHSQASQTTLPASEKFTTPPVSPQPLQSRGSTSNNSGDFKINPRRIALATLPLLATVQARPVEKSGLLTLPTIHSRSATPEMTNLSLSTAVEVSADIPTQTINIRTPQTTNTDKNPPKGTDAPTTNPESITGMSKQDKINIMIGAAATLGVWMLEGGVVNAAYRNGRRKEQGRHTHIADVGFDFC